MTADQSSPAPAPAEALREVLEWYADPSNWKQRQGRWDHLPTGLAVLLDKDSNIELDRGNRARVVLRLAQQSAQISAEAEGALRDDIEKLKKLVDGSNPGIGETLELLMEYVSAYQAWQHRMVGAPGGMTDIHLTTDANSYTRVQVAQQRLQSLNPGHLRLLAQQPTAQAPAEALAEEIAALTAEYETLPIVDNGLWYPLGNLIELLEKQASVARSVELWRGDVAKRRAALATAEAERGTEG